MANYNEQVMRAVEEFTDEIASVLMVKAFEVSIVCFQKAASLRGLPTFSSRQ